MPVIIDQWKARRSNTLRGFADITLPSGMRMMEVAIHVSNGRAWASPPSKPWLKGEAVMRGDDGKIRYSPIIEFTTKELRDRWSNAVIDAIRLMDPSVLTD